MGDTKGDKGPSNGGGANAASYRIEYINTLALPKNRAPKCEMTGMNAKVALITKDITLYYATEEHAENSWHGVISKIGHLLGPLRSPPPIVGNDEDRIKRSQAIRASKSALIGVCLQEASKFLIDGKPHLSIPGAMQALMFAKEVYGDGTSELTPPYLILAEANLGLVKFQQAEEFLALANWTILNNPNTSNAVCSQLHRNFGKLYSAQGRLDDALGELSKDIYWSSLEYGPEHVLTSPGYFLMGSIFHSQHRPENALAMFDKAVDVWYKFLGSPQANSDRLGEAQIKEGLDMLKRIHNTREKLLGNNHIATGEAKYILGLLHLYIGHKKGAKQLFEAAYTIYQEQLGPDHPSTANLMRVLQDVRTALEIHAFDSGDGDGDLNYLDGESIEARFPKSLPLGTTNSPIPTPPYSQRTSTAESL